MSATVEIAIKIEDKPPYVFVLASPYFYEAAQAVANARHAVGYGTPTLTSGCDGSHGTGSRHPYNLAWDWRTNDMNGGKLPEFLRQLNALLPAPTWYVLYEGDHVHTERKIIIP
jgi:hypothetical protein